MKVLTACIIYLVLFFRNDNTSIAVENKKTVVKQDTVYLMIDSIALKKTNTFDFVLVLQSKNEKHEILRERNQDYSVEFDSLPFIFVHNNLKMEGFIIRDLPTGRDKTVIWNRSLMYFI